MLLGVNIDHVATLRQARQGNYPSPAKIALLAEKAGADGITLHLREDRRHVQEFDLKEIIENKTTRVNLETAVTDEALYLVDKYRPEAVCLVPEKRQEITTEGGLDVLGNQSQIKQFCNKLHQLNCQVSLFVDPVISQIEASKSCNVKCVEIHTGAYANAHSDKKLQLLEFKKIKQAVSYASKLGLIVNAGHGLNLDNLAKICTIREVAELNIGHALISDALILGIERAVKSYKQIMQSYCK